MSHFFTVVLVEPELEKDEIEERVSELLAPYDENLQINPYRVYLDPEDIKNMAEHYKLDPNNSAGIIKKIKDWSGDRGGIDDKGLYRISTYNPKSKWDWWRIGGRWNGEIKGAYRGSKDGFNFDDEFETLEENICPISELPENLEIFAIVTPDGFWHEKGHMGWFGCTSNINKDWKKIVKDLLKKYSNYIAIGCDLHI